MIKKWSHLFFSFQSPKVKILAAVSTTIKTSRATAFNLVSHRHSSSAKKLIALINEKKVEKFVEKEEKSIPNTIPTNKEVPLWLSQKIALKKKFKQWNPPKKLNRDTMNSIRLLKQTMPDLDATTLANQFKVSPDAIRRILKSKWNPRTEEERTDVEDRWIRRGQNLLKNGFTVNPPKRKIIISNGESIATTTSTDNINNKRSKNGSLSLKTPSRKLTVAQRKLMLLKNNNNGNLT
ncbi:mitochondrial ribosome assembly protein RRG9 SCDLUD_003011 [Saccharomycodes ludwigii]|uniref:mitochondrial ribosome assembly protein RRG9 n=1 Tax=Saccharomycodes ludwigii TaxID=36035 RepID=UPI001E86DE5F|nr:hypothetical protein SCDLUD_003011 [Saccharomycodes ludwigii]KAH3901515.1 hypothetical protein SCDLUD_003011 [Saccharomycodes ludwigii]